MKGFFYMCLVLLVSFNACNQAYYKTEEIWTGDTLTVLSYDTNDNLRKEITFVGDLKEGIETHYYQNGQIELRRNWSGDELSGDYFKYYNLQDTVIIKDKGGPYLALQSRVREYSYYEFGTQIFLIDFTEEGRVQEWNGNLVLSVVLPEPPHLVGDSLRIQIQLPLLDFAAINLELYLQKENSEKYIGEFEVSKADMIASLHFYPEDAGTINFKVKTTFSFGEKENSTVIALPPIVLEDPKRS